MIQTALPQIAVLVLILISASVNRDGLVTSVKLTMTNAYLHHVNSRLSATISSMDSSAHAHCPTRCVKGLIGGQSSFRYSSVVMFPFKLTKYRSR